MVPRNYQNKSELLTSTVKIKLKLYFVLGGRSSCTTRMGVERLTLMRWRIYSGSSARLLLALSLTRVRSLPR